MEMMILEFLPLIGFFIFAVKRILTFLHIFQQEEYDPKRFVLWLFQNKAFDKRVSVTLIALYFTGFFIQSEIGMVLLTTLIFIAFAFREPNPLKMAKKKLVLTNRAKRIGFVAFSLFDVIAIATAFFAPSILYWIIPVQLIPFCLAAAVLILKPMDASVNARFRQEAVEKLEEIDPFIIAITGSFGKTSVKHILGHLMQSYAPTLITPGSVNTEMGITRIIREQLQPHHKYFIVEMGAYGKGSIARLCALTPPKLSAITAIGAAHYERFKTLDETAMAKLEIAHAARENGGKTILHSSTFEHQPVEDYYKEHASFVIRCAKEGDVVLKKAKQTAKGLDITLVYNEVDYKVVVPLYGLHHADNIATAFCLAIELGMTPEDIISSLKTVPQISHRLEVKEMPESYTIIDDAYNSNPVGFASALELLDMMAKEKGGRRILVTPGMIEMGDKHDEAHAELGLKAAEHCDVVLAVKAERIESFVETFLDNASQEQILFKPESFAFAQAWLNENAHENDVVLLENDLPDLFEKKIDL